MTDWSMNNTVPEPDRSCDNVGFGGMVHHTTSPSVQKEPTVPYNKPSPLENAVNPSSDTQKGQLPAPCGNFARRTS